MSSSFWLLDHVIYLELKKKYILSENSYHFCDFSQLRKQLFLSQLEINHVIQQPTAKN